MSTFFLHTHWQIAGEYQDSPITGFADIDLCVNHILSTRKGSDILRPQFGCDHFDYIDQPSDVAIPNIVREIHVALATWEKRIIVDKIRVSGEAPHFNVMVFYRLKDEVNRELYSSAVIL